jgi:uncharacterized protein (TIGR00369 family)
MRSAIAGFLVYELSMAPDTENVPDGYVRHFRKSPLTAPWEPLFSKKVDGIVVIGMRVRQPHCNGRGFLHGGLISALADNAMGLSVLETINRQGAESARQAFTVSLTLDYLAPARMDQWVEFVPRVLKVGAGTAFADCLVLADASPIARGNAIFRVYPSQPPAPTDM